MSPLYRARLSAAVAALAEARTVTDLDHARLLISEARSAITGALNELERGADESHVATANVTQLREGPG